MPTNKSLSRAELRKNAEQEMQAHADEFNDPLMTDEKRLLHELQVHQIELEMQNETLQETLIKVNEEHSKAEQASSILKALIDVCFDGYCVLDLAGNFQQVNAAYAKVSGYSVEELLNMHISQLEANAGPEQVKAHIARIIEQGYDLFETLHRHKDGQLIDMEVSAAYLAEFEQFCCFCRDISQRKQAEAQLNAIFNASLEGIISIDLYNIIVSVNPAVETILGYKQEELIGCNLSKLIQSLPKCRNQCSSLPSAAQPVAEIIEIEGRHKNGYLVPLELSRTQYTINNSCYFVVIMRDISLRKQREQQDKAHLDELAHITRIGLMGEMASGIAHEVNQPLTAISNYTQANINLINSEYYDMADILDILYKIQRQALRAGQIIHRMREFIKFKPQQRSSVEINALIHDAVNLCADDIKQNSIKLTLALEKNLPPINADHIQIEQVLINLIKNSIDALQSLPENRSRQLSIQTHLVDDHAIEISVKDNGPGIHQEQQLKILTPFYTTKKAGMGMGLSICRSLIEAHHGKLQFNSQPRKGTVFYFTLPTRTKDHAV